MTSVVTILLSTLALVHGEPVLGSFGIPTNCSKVCGVSENLNRKDLRLLRPVHNVESPLKNATCVKEQYLQWTNSTRRFMAYIGLNERKFRCTRLSNIDGPKSSNYLPRPEADSLDLPRLKNLVFKDDLQIEKPRDVSGTCHVKIGRGLLRRGSNGSIFTDWLFSSTVSKRNSTTALGSAFFIFETKTRDAHSYHVPRNGRDRCVGDSCRTFRVLWLPASVFRTSVTYEEKAFSTRRFLSMFANWEAEEVPGMNKLLDKLTESEDTMKNIDNDLSTSNLAILCLPLIMSIPPISLLGSVSNAATLWYTFATDFLAALPLLIKGIELIIAYKKATPSMVSTISMMGENYGIFERWFVKCPPLSDKFGWLGPGLISVAAWFIVASTYVEFLFWRLAQYKREHLKEKGSETEELVAEELPDRATETPSDLNTSPGLCFRLPRKRSIALGLIFIAAAIGLTVCQSLVRRSHIGCVTSDAAFSILVILLRAMILRRLFQFVQWRFLSGILFGLLCGPLYLVLNVFTSVRKSEKWAEVSDGAHIGFASLAMILNLVVDLKILDISKRYITGSAVFMIVFGISIALLHLIRSEGRDVAVWGYAVHGFALGVLFGPFGILFRRCFHEVQPRNKRIQRILLCGTAYGMLFVCVVIPNIIGNILRS